MTTPDVLQAYNASRDAGVDNGVSCHAPFVSLNFAQNGQVTACCYNRRYVLGTYPDQSVREIWTGAKARSLREAFLRNAEAPGCELCFHQLKNRNFGGVLMRNFDRYARDPAYRPGVDPSTPRVLELEISNTCNLECIMCSGYWSSSIRAHREKLPPLRSPYDQAFVDELEEFVPTLAGAKFLGGEPFLIERYYDIWERFRRLNPNAELSITTNATILPKRARELLEELRVNFAVSLDGFTPATYEAIRKNARFDEVMSNVEYLIDYTRRRGTTLSLAICPMTYNWRELPALLEFCERRKLALHFNTVLRPAEASLGGLPPAELAEVIDYLESFRPAGDGEWARGNRRQWEGLVNQLRGWHQEKLQFDRSCSDLETRVLAFSAGNRGFLPESFERLLPPVTLSLRLALERAARGRGGGDLSTLLPRTPIALVLDGEPPTTHDLLLAAHLSCRFLDEVENPDATAPDSRKVLGEQRLLRQYLEQADGSAGRRVKELGHWMAERIRTGEGNVLVLWMKVLLEALERPMEWRSRIEEGLHLLRTRGLDEAGCRKVAAYLEGMAAPFVPMPCLSPFGEGVLGANLEAPARPPPIGDVSDLERVLDAMFVFYCCRELSGDRARFRRRLDACLTFINANGKGQEACRSLENLGFSFAYELLAHATDEEMERHLWAFR